MDTKLEMMSQGKKISYNILKKYKAFDRVWLNEDVHQQTWVFMMEYYNKYGNTDNAGLYWYCTRKHYTLLKKLDNGKRNDNFAVIKEYFTDLGENDKINNYSILLEENKEIKFFKTFFLVYIIGYSFVDVANKYGITRQAVIKRCNRVLNKLKIKFKGEQR